MPDDRRAPERDPRLAELRAAADAVAALERAPFGSPDAERAAALAGARLRADAAAHSILAAPPGVGDPAARYEAGLWLRCARRPAPAAGEAPVAGALAAVDPGALVHGIETIDGLAAIHALALGLAESCVLRGGPPVADPDAAFAAGELGRFGHALALAATERLEATRPTCQADARLRAACLIAQAVSRGDGRALERAAMIAMEAGLEMYELEE
jgi:hypothetical protein